MSLTKVGLLGPFYTQQILEQLCSSVRLAKEELVQLCSDCPSTSRRDWGL